MKKCLQQVKLLFSVLAKLAIWVDILHFLNRCSWAQNICFKFLIQNTGTCKLFWFFLCNFLACTRRICLRPIELMFGSTHLNDSHENWILQGWPCCGGVIPGRDQVTIHHRGRYFCHFVIIIIISARPKPPYERPGLAFLLCTYGAQLGLDIVVKCGYSFWGTFWEGISFSWNC